MYPTSDLEQVRSEMSSGHQVVVVEESKAYPGELLFQTLDQVSFNSRYSDYLSIYSMLLELFLLDGFVQRLEADGWKVMFLGNTSELLQLHSRWSKPLSIEGLTLPNGSTDLYEFQQFSIRRLLDLHHIGNKWDGFFLSWGTGSGKSIAACAVLQELMVNRNDFDLALVVTPAKLMTNMKRFIEGATQCQVELLPVERAPRLKKYQDKNLSVVVINYEKFRVDYDELEKLVKGKRVLFLLDEVQKTLQASSGRTLARRGLQKLFTRTKRSFVIPMTATSVKKDPLRYHDVFSLTGANPLGGRGQFKDDYYERVESYKLPGTKVLIENVIWDTSKLESVKHRVGLKVQAVRKTDPGVREHFKGMTTEIIPVQLSDNDRAIYQYIEDLAADASESGIKIGANYYNHLRWLCNTSESLAVSGTALSQNIAGVFGEDLSSNHSAKFEMIADKIETIQSQGDKVVVFTQWTNLSLFLFEKVLAKRSIKYVPHHGGMKAAAAQASQDKFKQDPDTTVFLSSDAGAFGLNFQEARYVINIEAPPDYDTLLQRNDRIDRADSYLDGLTSYVYVVENSVEERVWKMNDDGRKLSAVTQGTVETLSRPTADQLTRETEFSASTLTHLTFGARELSPPSGVLPF